MDGHKNLHCQWQEGSFEVIQDYTLIYIGASLFRQKSPFCLHISKNKRKGLAVSNNNCSFAKK